MDEKNKKQFNFKIEFLDTQEFIYCDICKDKNNNNNNCNIYSCNDVCNNYYNVCEFCIHKTFYFDYQSRTKSNYIVYLKNKLNDFDNNEYQNKLYSSYILCLYIYYDFLHFVFYKYTNEYNTNLFIEGLLKLVNTDLYYNVYQHIFNIDLYNLINYDDSVLKEHYDNDYFIEIIKCFLTDLDSNFIKLISKKDLNEFTQDYNSNHYKFIYSEFTDINIIDFIRQNYKILNEKN